MNTEQATSIARWLVTMFGGVIAGYFAATGWASADTIMSILNSGTFMGMLVAVISLVLSWFKHSEKGIIQSAAALPAVKEIVTDAKTANVIFKDNSKVISGVR